MFAAIESFLVALSPDMNDNAPGPRLATALCLDIPLGAQQLTQSVIEAVRKTIERYNGKTVDQGPRKLIAIFDGSIRAMRCALAINGELHAIGIAGRIGMHSGSVEVEDTMSGAIRVAVQLASMAAPGSIIASQDVKNISPGSGFKLESLGGHVIAELDAPLDLFLVTDRLAEKPPEI